jgi:hypothetical protein
MKAFGRIGALTVTVRDLITLRSATFSGVQHGSYQLPARFREQVRSSL